MGESLSLRGSHRQECDCGLLTSRREKGSVPEEKCPAGVFYRRRPVTDSPYRRDRPNVRKRTADVK